MSRERIKECVKEMQKEGADVNALVKEIMELKRELGDPIPKIDESKLSGKAKLKRIKPKSKSKPKKKRASRAKKKSTKSSSKVSKESRESSE